ncbi:MAG: hypothetical protein PHI86_04595 [Candidatus Omnitrophica bacterium]|nr:hypothetical protein [Candidatus Omnitrophota bacterium]
MNEAFLVNNLIFVLVVIIVLAAGIISAKKTRKALSQLTAYLPGALSKFPFDPSYRGVYQGLNFVITLTQGGKNSPPYLRVLLMKKSTFQLSLYKESLISELGKKVGVVKEVKINDEVFDKDFFIFSNKPDKIISYFSNGEIKNTARELFDVLGFNGLIINEQGLKAQKVNYNLNIDLEPQRIINALQKLSILARGCN